MQIICLQENLKKALNITDRIIGRNLTLPILNNLLLSTETQQLKVSSTNLEIGINCWISGKIIKAGSLTIPAKLLSNLVVNLPNKKIELKVKDNQLILKCENFKAQIKGLKAEEFPIIPQIKNQPIVKLSGYILKTALSQVVEMAAFSESRPEISGVYMKFDVSTNQTGKNLIQLAATDSFRLAEKNIQEVNLRLTENKSIIIPKRTILELIRILGEEEKEEVSIVLDENQILFDLNNVQLISRLIDGQYPDYPQIIPKDFQTQLTVNREELIKNIKIASFFSGKTNEVKLIIQPEKSSMTIFAQDIDLGQNRSQLEAKINGRPIEISFNYQYLLDGLNNIFSDKVIFSISKESAKTVIRPVGDTSYLYLVMPIKT